ncbi:hypothetical protein HDU67_002722 [Dinochytrium kinnereticum]|nr:hypothetical protein HDU67_002722 [Dinochytrium kinnereticum]
MGTLGLAAQGSILEMSLTPSRTLIVHEAEDEPAYFVKVLFDADASDYANEEHFVRHLVQRLRESSSVNTMWTPSRFDQPDSCCTLKQLGERMEAIYKSLMNEQVNKPTVKAFTTTTGKPKVTNFSQDGGPDESLKRKAAPNTIGKTGYRFGQLKAMSPSQRQKIVKAAGLTCNNCNTAGHISLDCSRAKAPSASKVAETQTNYKALLAKIPEEEIQAFLASHTKKASQITGLNALVSQTEIPTEQDSGADLATISHQKKTIDTSKIPPKAKFSFAAMNVTVDDLLEAHLTQLDSGVSQWIYDTGLNHEALTPFKEDLEDSRPYSVVIDGAFAGNSSKAIGTVRGYSNLGHAFEFKALYVPGIRARLLSRNTLAERDIYLADGPHYCLRDLNHLWVFRGSHPSPMYPTLPVSTQMDDSTKQQSRRRPHGSPRSTDRLDTRQTTY